MTTNIVEIQNEIKKELANKEVMNALVTTTFKGLNQENIYLALREGMMRGITFQDFLEKNYYAIPFENKRSGRQEYSIIVSIDHARKVGMRSGVVGVTEPIYEEKDGKVISCTITVKRKVNDYVGEYTAKVYFNEYNTGRNQWLSRPRTMIAKVAEMHALRKACPEELSQAYSEEEKQQEMEEPIVAIDLAPHKAKLSESKDVKDLKANWDSLPVEAKTELEPFKNELKAKLSTKNETH